MACAVEAGGRKSSVRQYRQHEVSPEDKERLRLSMAGLEGIVFRDIRCPYCGFLVAKMGSDVRSGHKQVRCGKCKESFVIDFRYFRTMKKRDPYKPFRLRLVDPPKKRQVR